MSTHNSQPPQSLKESIQNVSQQPTADESFLDELLTLQDELLGTDNIKSAKPDTYSLAEQRNTEHKSGFLKAFTNPVAGVAASVLLVMGLVFWNMQPDNFSEQIAYEVVKNHLKLKPLDIKTQSMTDIQSFFTQLDFSPSRSSVLNNTLKLGEQFMLGGRYCSIKGVTAAQLRYQRDDISTFYQVPFDRNLHGDIPDPANKEAPLSLMIKGLNVTLWREKGLLMVLINEA